MIEILYYSIYILLFKISKFRKKHSKERRLNIGIWKNGFGIIYPGTILILEMFSVIFWECQLYPIRNVLVNFLIYACKKWAHFVEQYWIENQNRTMLVFSTLFIGR